MKVTFEFTKQLGQHEVATVLRQIADDLNSMEEFDVLMDGSVLFITDYGKVFMLHEEDEDE